MVSYRKLLLIPVLFILTLSSNIAQGSSIRPATCRFTVPRGVEIECMRLTVPENRLNPHSNSIEISLAILRNPSANPEPDPIIFLQGGPGGTTLGTLQFTYENRFEPLFETNRDIILFDQRGTGNSYPALDCAGLRAIELNLLDYNNDGQFVSRPEIEILLNRELADCGTELSNQYDLSGYNSIQNAADIEAIRLALGYEQVNLWGISYGSRLALTAMRDYPDSFRRVVLDAVYPVEANLYTELPGNFNRALDELFNSCERNTLCNRTYPDLETVFFDTVQRLNDDPIRFNTSNPYTGEVYSGVFFDGDLMLHTLFELLYATDMLPRLPELIYAAYDGNFDTWIYLVGWLASRYDNFYRGMYYSVQCQEEYYFTEAGSIRAAWAAYPQFESYSERIEFVEQMNPICEAFDSAGSPEIENQAVNSNIPALLMAGQFDPITPPRWAEQVNAQLTNSQFLEFPAHGHGSSAFQGCAQNIVIDFFRLEDIADLDTSCIDDIRIRFSGTYRNEDGSFGSRNNAAADQG